MKNPTVSAGFEPTNLGTKGQHATSRPPEPLNDINFSNFLSNSAKHCKFFFGGTSYTETWTAGSAVRLNKQQSGRGYSELGITHM